MGLVVEYDLVWRRLRFDDSVDIDVGLSELVEVEVEVEAEVRLEWIRI